MTTPTTSPARRRSGEAGQALVEFVFVLPVFLALLFTVIEFAMLMNYNGDVNHVAAETARKAAVYQGDTAFDPVAHAEGAAEDAIADDIVVDVCMPDGTDPGDTVQIEVRLTRDVMGIVPGDIADVTVTGRAAMRLEAEPDFAANSTDCTS